MVTHKFRYVVAFHDRHGKERIYLRRHGKHIPLPGPVGSPRFVEAYQDALSEMCRKPGAGHNHGPRSLGALVIEYRKSGQYQALKDSTKSAYNGPLEWLIKHYGAERIADLSRADVVKIQGRKAKEGMAAANTVIKILRLLVGHAIALGWRTTDPTLKIKKLPEGEHRAW